MLGRGLIQAILLLPACLPHTSETKRGSGDYQFDVSKFGYAAVRYIDREGKGQILRHSIARLSLASIATRVPALTDTVQLQRAGSDAQQALQGIESPAVAGESFYVIDTAKFYLQDSDDKKYFCQLAGIPLGSKQNFSLSKDCKENAQETSMVYFNHHFDTTKHQLDEDILQIDCEINYGNQKQAIHLAVQNGTIIDDRGRYAFAKQNDTSFKIKCRNSFLHKPVAAPQQFTQKMSKELTAKTSQRVCVKLSDGTWVFNWGSVKSKIRADCDSSQEPLSFDFSDTAPTHDYVPLYLYEGKPLAARNRVVTDQTLQQDIRVLTQCNDCLPAWASQLRCTTTCKHETLVHADKVAAPGTIIAAGANKHYSQRRLCKHETQTLSALSQQAALTCTVFAQDSENDPQSNTATLDLTSEIIRGGKVCVDFSAPNEIAISAAANCHSKLRFFFKAAKQSQ